MFEPEVRERIEEDGNMVVPNQLFYQVVRLRKEMGPKEKTASGEDCPIAPIAKCDGLECLEPDRYLFEGSILQQLVDEKGIEFLICATMYNEGEAEFQNTMKGVMNNMREFQSHGIPPKRIACIIVVDGTTAFMKTFKDGKLNSGQTFQKFFDPEVIKQRFNVPDIEDIRNQMQGDMEIAHCFQQVYQEKDVSLNVIFCVKQKNMRKLNSHLWFFCGFCKMINPRFVMLLDVGTKPHETALWQLYEAMDLDENCAGCCGEIIPMDPPMFNWVVPAQVVEYKYAHIFDKALESVCGYISVLPGAFSAYRWDQLLGSEQNGSPIWNDYFRSMTHPHEMDAYLSNIYLAEDRVLTLALVSMKNRANMLRFVHKCIAETDVPDTFNVLLMQRRRWINGSWFALIDFLRHFGRIYESDHTLKSKIIMSIQIIWNFSTDVISWVMVGCFALMVETLLPELGMSGNQTNEGFSVESMIIIVYAGLLVATFILALSVKPKQVENTYKVLSGLFGFYMIASVVLMIRFLIDMDQGEKTNNWIFAFCILIALLMLLTPALYGALGTILKHLLMFLLMCPTYVNIFFIYAICNTHDCTWGNRETTKNEAELRQADDFSLFRCRWAIVWVSFNLAFYLIVHQLSTDEGKSSFNVIYMIGIYSFIALVSRFVGSVLYLIQEKYYKKKYAPGEPAKAALGGDTDENRANLPESNFEELPAESLLVHERPL